MSWNWQLPDWPNFKYNPQQIKEKDKEFLLSIGSSFAFLSNINNLDRNQFIVEILSIEGLESSKIEGEILERKSLQSSIKKHFGLANMFPRKKEEGMADLLCNVYETYDKPLTHEMLWEWHALLFKEWGDLTESGKYRSQSDPCK